MKRVFSSLVVGVLILVPINAFAAVKAGASCSKLGAISTYAGKKYTCIKSGKKLVWDKGIVNAAQKPTSNTTPTSTSSTNQKGTNTSSAGDLCTKVGEKVNNSLGYLECRSIAGNKQQYFQLSNSLSALDVPTTSDSLNVCQLKDQRPFTNKYDWQEFRAIAYPAKPERGFVNSGEVKIVIVGVDYNDAPGKGTPTSIIEETIKNSSQWIKWYSHDNVNWSFLTYDKWIRAPRDSQELKSAEVGADAQISDALKHEYIGEIDKYIDLRNTSAIWIVYPDSVSKIYAESQNRSYWNPKIIKNGSVSPAMFAIGRETYLASRLPWLYFTHETMHGHGLMGHSPQWPYIFGLMNNEYSASHNLNGWESLVMGWGSTQTIYCKDIKKLTSMTLEIVPIEREQLGISTVLIRLSDSKVLAIESHRVDKWSPQQIPGLYGITTYVVDMAVDNKNNVVAPPGSYLKLNNVNHGLSPTRGQAIPGFENFGTYLIDGVGVAGASSTDLNVMMYLGESLIYEGVKISLVSSGDNDTIRIEKTS